MFILNILQKNRIIVLVALFIIIIKTGLFFWATYSFDFLNNPENNWINLWDHWDSGIYKTIAQSSYNFINIKLDNWAFLSHFPPLYPLIIFVASKIFNTSLINTGVLISFLSIIAASVMLYKLAILEFKNEKIAWLSVIFLNLYPTSYFTISIYSESLFLLLTIMSFYCLKKESYFGSGLTAMGAILTRLVGIVFLPIYALYLFHNYRNQKLNLKALFLLLFPLIGLIIYLIINKFYFGSYFYFFTEDLSFNTTKKLIIPFKETFFDFLFIFNGSNFFDQTFMLHRGWNAIFTIFALTISALGLKKISWIYTAYSLSSILLFASLSWGISNARYTLSVFPIFLILALIKNKFALLIILPISTFGLLYFTKIFTSGIWAF